MRNLFGKEHKSLKLQKKLQKEEEELWKLDADRRKEQEALDEAFAKELQAQLEASPDASPPAPSLPSPSPPAPSLPSPSPPAQSSSLPPGTPPPLPAKPTAYSSASFISSSQASIISVHNDNNHSTSSQLTSHPSRQSVLPPVEPIRPAHPPPYASPVPALPPRKNSSSDLSLHSTHSAHTSQSVPVTMHGHPPPQPSPAPMYVSSSTPGTTSATPVPHTLPIHDLSTTPVPQSAPQSLPPQSSFSHRDPAMLVIPPPIYPSTTHSSSASVPTMSMPQPSPVLRTAYSDTPTSFTPPPNQIHHPTPPATHPVQRPQHNQHVQSTQHNKPLQYNQPIQHIQPTQSTPHNQHAQPSPHVHHPQLDHYNQQTQSIQHGQYSRLRPDIAPQKPNEVETTSSEKSIHSRYEIDDQEGARTPTLGLNSGMAIPSNSESQWSDKSAKEDTSSKIRKIHVEEDGLDPFADVFAVETETDRHEPGSNKTEARHSISDTSTCPSVKAMRARLEKVLLEPAAVSDDEKVQETDDDIPRRRPLTVVLPHSRSQSMGALPVFQNTPQPIHSDVEEDPDPQPVYPTSILRAGAPPGLSSSISQPNLVATNTEVPADEYGYYNWDDTRSASETPVNKALPSLPYVNDKHRHITVPSINKGQRVWIQVHPTDTGKTLARRIGVVATFDTRKITKITTKTGRVLPLDDTPVFEDWSDIEKLQQGAAWKIEWGPLDSHLTEMLEGSKDFMRHLKATLRTSSS